MTLNVTIGEGLSVSVVNEDSVMPLHPSSAAQSFLLVGAGVFVVITTTECGIERMSLRTFNSNNVFCEFAFSFLLTGIEVFSDSGRDP